MPQIPRYNSSLLPGTTAPNPVQGVSAAPALGAVADVLGTAASVGGRIVQAESSRRAQEAAYASQVAQQWHSENDKSIASKALAEAQIEAVRLANEAERMRGDGQLDTASSVAKSGTEWVAAKAKTLTPGAAAIVRSSAAPIFASAQRAAMEQDDQYKTKYLVRNYADAQNAGQIAIQDAPLSMIDSAFVASVAGAKNSLDGNPELGLPPMPIDPETRAKLLHDTVKEGTVRAGEQVIGKAGPEEFFQQISGYRKVSAAAAQTLERAGVFRGRTGALIQRAAMETGVDPSLIGAIMAQESGGKSGLVSSAGAVGLMQLMPATAAELGVDPNNDAQNVLGGAKFLAHLLKQFGGDEKLAIAAYNAGPGAVQKAGGVPNYRETQDYVRKVVANLERMRTARGEIKVEPADVPEWWRLAGPDERDRLIGYAEKVRSERAAIDMTYLQDTVRNAQAAQTQGLPIDIRGLTGEAVVSAFGGDVDKARHYWLQNVQPLVDVEASAARMQGLSVADLDKETESLRPRNPSDPNFASDLARYNASKTAANNVLAQRAEDPMAMALSSPSVAAIQDPDKRIAAALAWQKTYVREKDRSVLLREDKDALARAWSDPIPARTAMEVLDQMQQKYGNYFDQALGEIADKAPSEALLFAGLSPESRIARYRLRQNVGKSIQDLTNAVPRDRVSRMDSALQREFAPYYSSLKATNATSGASYINRISEGVRKYALSLVQQNMSPESAAKQAMAELISEQYGFLEGGQMPGNKPAVVRVPAGVTRNPDISEQVQRGMDAILERPPKDLAFPRGVTRADALDRMYWATTANEQGAVLMLDGAPVRVQRDGAMVPFEVSWAALRNGGWREMTNN